MGNPAGKSKCGGQPDESAYKRTPGSKTSAREYRCATELGKPAMFSQDGSIGGAAPLKREITERTRRWQSRP